MPSQARHFISPFCTIVLVAASALWIASSALPTAAQNAQSSVPASAAAAAKQPEFAAKLAHPTRRPAPQQHPTGYHPRPVPPLDPTVYDNGPINGSVDAWTINFGYAVTDSFTLSSATTITSFQFGAWSYPGSTPISVDYSIGTSPFGGNPATVTVLSAFQRTNQYGYDIDLVTAAGLNVRLGPGTYWLTLQNAVVNTGDPLYWDENSGPSQAEDNVYGTIPSESFSVQGNSGNFEPACYQATGNLRIIHDFNPQQGGTRGATGVVRDRAGNLYGTTVSGGDNSAGLAYKLSNFGGWVLDSLYSFLGDDNGSEPGGVVLGPDGSLFGTAQGGNQNCGNDGGLSCGLVFKLAPQPTACRSTLCGWNETVPYRFTSESNDGGSTTVSAFDRQGNLYGTTYSGGAHGYGSVFQLMPSGGGWSETTLYSFTGGTDGYGATGLLAGNDGNLYGITYGGGLNNVGVVFQLTPSGGQWILSVVHAFGGSDGDSGPAFLVQNNAGTLYGTANYGFDETVGAAIFALVKTGSGWSFSQTLIQHEGYDSLNNLAIDSAGNLYGTGEDYIEFAGDGSKRPGGGYDFYNSYIFKASFDGSNWHHQDLIFLPDQVLGSVGNLALDSSGNLYGSGDCGTYNAGTVWQLSP